MNSLVKRVSSIFILSFFVLSAYATTGENPGEKNVITESAKIEYSIYPIINTNKIRVAYQKSGKEKIAVKIYDAKKNLLFSDVQKNDTYVKRNYNLDRIGEGTYFVKIVSGDYEIDQKVVVGKNTKSNFSAYLSPEPINNKVRIAFQHAINPVRIAVLNEDGSMLYDKVMYDTQNFSSLFNLSSLDKGNYTIKISSDDEVTEKNYSIN